MCSAYYGKASPLLFFPSQMNNDCTTFSGPLTVVTHVRSHILGSRRSSPVSSTVRAFVFIRELSSVLSIWWTSVELKRCLAAGRWFVPACGFLLYSQLVRMEPDASLENPAAHKQCSCCLHCFNKSGTPATRFGTGSAMSLSLWVAAWWQFLRDVFSCDIQ